LRDCWRAFQISVGFGAGNIGDEFMARAFWDALPENVRLEIPLFPEHVRQREPYPLRHRYLPVHWEGNENSHVESMPGLLVGDTPVTEAEGLHWPLGFLEPRLEHFHRRGLPVDALGVGVDRLQSAAARGPSVWRLARIGRGYIVRGATGGSGQRSSCGKPGPTPRLRW
jgi:hypothetical protein